MMALPTQPINTSAHTGWLGPMDYWHRNAPPPFNPAYDPGAGGSGCSYMCNALRGAVASAIITFWEFNAARDEVQQYVAELAGDGDPSSALASVFRLHFDDSAYPEGDFTELYRNWANRPMPSRLHSQPETHLD